MQALILASKNETLMKIIKKEIKADPDWTGAKASKITRELCKEFQPDDDVTESKMEDEIVRLKFKTGENPQAACTKLNALEVKYNLTITKVKKRTVVVRLYKKVYPQTITIMDMMQKANADAHNVATSDEMVDELYKQWRLETGGGTVKKSKDDDERANDTALNNVDMKAPGAFASVTCYNCEQKGHKANKYKNPKKSGAGPAHKRGKDKRKCNKCGKVGHLARDCWTKNPEKRPSNRKGTDTGASNIEIIVSSVEADEDGHKVVSIVEADEDGDKLYDASDLVIDTVAAPVKKSNEFDLGSMEFEPVRKQEVAQSSVQAEMQAIEDSEVWHPYLLIVQCVHCSLWEYTSKLNRSLSGFLRLQRDAVSHTPTRNMTWMPGWIPLICLRYSGMSLIGIWILDRMQLRWDDVSHAQHQATCTIVGHDMC